MKTIDYFCTFTWIVVAGILLVNRGYTQEVNAAKITNKIQVRGPQSIAEVLLELEKRYGWQMSYEDPPYESARDIADVTSPDFAREHPGRHQIRILGRPFEFTFSAPGDSGVPDRDSVLAELLRQHTASGNPGIFGISHTGSIANIEPVKLVKRSGETIPVHSILDTKITFPLAQRTVLETLELLLSAVRKEAGVNIAYFSPWGDSLLKQAISEEGPNEEPAKAVLVRILGDVNKWPMAPRHLVWDLEYGADEKTYYFFVHTVTVREVDSSGKVIGHRPI